MLLITASGTVIPGMMFIHWRVMNKPVPGTSTLTAKDANVLAM
jgi:hypothetical protein